MTCIAGLATPDGWVTMGADSGGVDDHWNLVARADPKLFRMGPYLIGFTSSFRMGQLLQYGCVGRAFPSPPEDPGRLHGFLCTTFVDLVRQVFKDAGWARVKDSQEQGGAFLLGVHGRLFSVEEDFQVAESRAGYLAVGSGQACALGALHATRNLGLSAYDRVAAALAAAEAHNIGVRGPFHVEATRHPPPR